jgi:hypothetical protein
MFVPGTHNLFGRLFSKNKLPGRKFAVHLRMKKAEEKMR